MSSNKLMESLRRFQQNRKENLTEDELADLFEDVARTLLFGGHFESFCGNRLVHRIYPFTVEFYYHEETGGVKDYIVYHRNPEDPKKSPNPLPAFSLGSLHAHISGIDITFEDQRENPAYRASALIRAYQVDDSKAVESRSTYLYDYLFSDISLQDGIRVVWQDDSPADARIHKGYRVNVNKYYINDKGKRVKRTKDTHPDDYRDRRPWAFSRRAFEEPYIINNQEAY